MELEVQGGDYEHVLEFAGEPGGSPPLRYLRVGLADLSRRVLRGEAFDAAEYSLANHIMLHASGGRRLAAIPVFPSRAFRNASVFVRCESPLHEISQLEGKRIAVNEFAMTAAVWARGHLQQQFGLDWRSIEWVVAAEQRFPPPAVARVRRTDRDLEALTAQGEVDALIAGQPSDLQRPPAQRRLRPLVADPEASERSYFAATGLFPIMHTVVLHERVLGDRDAPRRLFDAYVRAKRRALQRRLGSTFLPGAERLWAAWRGAGADPMPYGLTAANRRNIETLSRYLCEQGLAEGEPAVESLFLADSAGWSDE